MDFAAYNSKWKMSCLMKESTKINKVTLRPAKTQISLDIRPVWSESSLCAQWVAKCPAKTQISLDIRPGWSESSLGAQSFCWFCHEAAHIIHVYHIAIFSSWSVLIWHQFSEIFLNVKFWKTVLIAYANCGGSGEPAHPHSLTRAITVHWDNKVKQRKV